MRNVFLKRLCSLRTKQNTTEPPDLDAMIKNMLKKWRTIFHGNKTEKTPYQQGGILLVLCLIIGLWFLSGIFIVQAAERAVILRFGRYVKTVGPGPHWIPRFIDSQFTVNQQKIDTYYYDAEMLTLDENIVSVAVAVQYRILDLRAYLFNVVNPVLSLQQATASALRQVLGNTTLDAVLTSGRDQVRAQVQQQLENILDFYQTGIVVTDVALQPAKAPEEVKDAFDDAIKAQEDEQRYINQAQAYEKKVVPIAQGQAQRLIAAAEAYQQQVKLKAQGDTQRFLTVLAEYEKAAKVTRERLYLATMEGVLSRTTKVLIDLDKSNNLVYLPLDKLLPNANLIEKQLEPAPLKPSSPVKMQPNKGRGTSRTSESEYTDAVRRSNRLMDRYNKRNLQGEIQ